MAQLKSNSLMVALEQNEGTVLIRGYVGEGKDGQINLYPKLNPVTRFVIDSRDIVHAIESENDEEPARIFIKDSAEVKIVSTVKAEALKVPVGPLGSCHDQAYDWWIKCLESGFGIDFCTAGSDWIQSSCEILKAPETGPATKT